MALYESYSKWEWRFGETPQFANSLEHKFDWALVDVQFNVERGVIVQGQIFSDCLVPAFIDSLNDELATGTITYDQEGIRTLFSRVKTHFPDGSFAMVHDQYIPELQEWLCKNI